MQISAHTRPPTPGMQTRAQLSQATAMLAEAVRLSSGQGGGQTGGYAREGRHAASDPQAARRGDKTVFVARSLSSTLNQLQFASFAAEPPTPARTDARPAEAKASLDELLSTVLAAA